MRENAYQKHVKDEIRNRLPGALVIKNDPNETQGMPDLLILYKGRYAFLEVKRSKDAPHRPNQDYYVKKFGRDAFSSFIFPENEKEILDGLQRALGA